MRTFLFFWALQMAALVLHAQVLHTKSSLNGTPSQTSDTIIQSNNPPDTVDYTLNLSELVVKATMPKTKMKNGAMVTRIEGSVLETAGTAEDMLSRVPGMMRRGGVLQVIGKGTPIYYINGRKVQNEDELSRLKSADIREVEVISAPGAIYDAEVNAVVRIKTRPQQGEGVSGRVATSNQKAIRYGNNQFASSVDVNYRHQTVDIFGGVNFQNNHLDNYSYTLEQHTYTPEVIHSQYGVADCNEQVTMLHMNLGMNWQINNLHVVGMKIERGQWLHNSYNAWMKDAIYRNQQLQEALLSKSRFDKNQPNTFQASAYYSSTPGPWTIEANFDYYSTREKTINSVDEQSEQKQTVMNALSRNRSHLYAGKLLVGHPLWRGTMKVGGEVTTVCRTSSYAAEGVSLLRQSDAHVKELNGALFAEYSRFFPKAGMLTMGLRYEHVDFDYNDRMNSAHSIHRQRDEFFPSLSFATRIGLLQMHLSGGIKTNRPTYYDLRSEIAYGSRYTLQTGNPTLKNETSRHLDLQARWCWIALQVGYSHIKNAIYDWTSPYNDQGVVLIHMINFDQPIDRLGAFVNISPTIGCWTISNTVGIEKQWLTFQLDDPRTATGQREVQLDKPMWIFNSNNAFSLKHRWQLELNSEFYSKAHFRNVRLLEHFWNLTAVVQKKCLRNDALTLRLSVSDIFNTARHDALIDLGNYTLLHTNVFSGQRTAYSFQRINLSIRYSFNATKSKYRGQGAGQEMMKRL